jgi:hypothetical protein
MDEAQLWRALGAAVMAAALCACGPRTDAAPSGETADAPAPNEQEAQAREPASFIVRFRAPHPLAHAQELFAAGHCAEAEQLARTTIAARAELGGLCFQRFTVGGAELVLSACEAPAPEALAAFQHSWAERFAHMDGVEYAEPNAVASPAACASPEHASARELDAAQGGPGARMLRKC